MLCNADKFEAWTNRAICCISVLQLVVRDNSAVCSVAVILFAVHARRPACCVAVINLVVRNNCAASVFGLIRKYAVL